MPEIQLVPETNKLRCRLGIMLQLQAKSTSLLLVRSALPEKQCDLRAPVKCVG